jgi:hypothetical protein
VIHITLDELANSPERALELPDKERQSFALKCIAVLGALAVAPEALVPVPEQEDRLLTAEEAAPRMGTTANWMRRKGRRVPFSRRVGRFWRFSEIGLNAYLTQRGRR